MPNDATDLIREIEGQKAFRDAGQAATAVGAVLLGWLPVVGDAVGEASKLFERDHSEDIISLARLVVGLDNRIDEISDRLEQFAAVERTILRNETLRERAQGLLDSVINEEPKLFELTTEGAHQSLSNVIIERMKVTVSASDGGRNDLRKVRTEGEDVHFRAVRGGVNYVSDSVFKGTAGNVFMDRVALSGVVQAGVTGGQPFTGLSNGGSIHFRPGSSIGFGPPATESKK